MVTFLLLRCHNDYCTQLYSSPSSSSDNNYTDGGRSDTVSSSFSVAVTMLGTACRHAQTILLYGSNATANAIPADMISRRQQPSSATVSIADTTASLLLVLLPLSMIKQ